jgi:hypothetical protein
LTQVAGVGETRFPEICGECRENIEWVGPSKRRTKRCGCTPPPAPKVRGRLNTAKKGRRLEVSTRKALEAMGVKRVVLQPGSGAYGTRNDIKFLQGDLSVQIAGRTFALECKSRADDSGFKVIKDWMQGCDVLVIKQDRQPAMHVLSDEAWLHLVGAANGASE